MQGPHYDASRHVTREQMKLADTISSESYGISSAALMETAGRAVAEAVWERLPEPKTSAPVAVLCGPGNNGGDGYVASRYLHNWGVPVQVYLIGRAGTDVTDGDAGANFQVVRKMGLPLHEIKLTRHLERCAGMLRECALIVDAILGTGLSSHAGRVREPASDVITFVNGLGRPIVAVDVPSGLDANSGEVLGVCIRATVTVTMALPKAGFRLGAGPEHAGEVVVADIGIPSVLLAERQGSYLYRDEQGKSRVTSTGTDTDVIRPL